MAMPQISGVEKSPNPEETAIRFLLHQDQILHNRLNYWLLTEGIFFTAAAAFAGLILKTPNDFRWLALYALSVIGFSVTWLWQAIIMRADAIANWYSSRVRALHWRRYGFPQYCFDVDTESVFPWESPESLWRGHGINILDGSNLMSCVFATAWSGVMGYSASRIETWGDWVKVPLLVLTIILWIGYVSFLVISRRRMKEYGRRDRKRLSERLSQPMTLARK